MTDPRILVCGNRDWTHVPTIARWMSRVAAMVNDYKFGSAVIVHGACGVRDDNGVAIKGADVLADDLARRWGWIVDPYPADWDRYRNQAGPIRNALMLDAGNPVIGIAFGLLHRNGRQTGTGDMVRRMNARGVPVILVGRPEGA